MKKLGTLKYHGAAIDLNGLEDGHEYIVTGFVGEFVRVVDGTGGEYLYDKKNPASVMHPEDNGTWEIVSDPDGIIRTSI